MMDYGDIVVCAPITVPYVRHSDKSAAWWLGTALRKLIETSGLAKPQIDGLCLSSFTLAPDGPAQFTQYVGLSMWVSRHAFWSSCQPAAPAA
jgi:hypothetical protein